VTLKEQKNPLNYHLFLTTGRLDKLLLCSLGFHKNRNDSGRSTKTLKLQKGIHLLRVKTHEQMAG
jgi:hypothetical protein